MAPATGASALLRTGRAAVVALYDELALEPKPGLVSFVDSGSHSDMNAHIFVRSLFSLRHTFSRLAAVGAAGGEFRDLEREGVAAEARMLHATTGEPTQNLLRFRGAQAQGCSKFDHLVILLADQIPLDRTGQDGLQVRIGIGMAGFGAVELLSMEIFQAW